LFVYEPKGIDAVSGGRHPETLGSEFDADQPQYCRLVVDSKYQGFAGHLRVSSLPHRDQRVDKTHESRKPEEDRAGCRLPDLFVCEKFEREAAGSGLSPALCKPEYTDL
jgi:hypothetical protein